MPRSIVGSDELAEGLYLPKRHFEDDFDGGFAGSDALALLGDALLKQGQRRASKHGARVSLPESCSQSQALVESSE